MKIWICPIAILMAAAILQGCDTKCTPDFKISICQKIKSLHPNKEIISITPQEGDAKNVYVRVHMKSEAGDEYIDYLIQYEPNGLAKISRVQEK